MKIGLLDVDGHKNRNNKEIAPNYALMKISAYEKKQRNNPEWVNFLENYDRIYMSKVFSFTEDNNFPLNADEIIKGGTGYKDISIKLPQDIDDCEPDYSLYPDFKHSLGFLTRGCIRNCSWCIVPKKEGKIQPYRDIETILQNRKSAIIMDNNVLASDFGLRQIEKIIDLKCKIDFNQGLDARLITNEIAKMLVKIKWIDYLRLACDTQQMLSIICDKILLLKKLGFKMSKIFVYCLLTDDINECYNRLNFLKNLGVKPFAQPFIDFSGKRNILQWQLDMARWCNHKALFYSTDFKDYQARKGFICNKYFI